MPSRENLSTGRLFRYNNEYSPLIKAAVLCFHIIDHKSNT
jgi:hypothetical protein